VRSRDPYAAACDGWILRRLAPDCARILFDNLPDKAEMDLFYAMGAETANIHLASPKSVRAIVADLDHRHGDWLVEPVKAMADALSADFSEWRDAKKTSGAVEEHAKPSPSKRALSRNGKPQEQKTSEVKSAKLAPSESDSTEVAPAGSAEPSKAAAIAPAAKRRPRAASSKNGDTPA
jgi:hypothetical protein